MDKQKYCRRCNLYSPITHFISKTNKETKCCLRCRNGALLSQYQRGLIKGPPNAPIIKKEPKPNKYNAKPKRDMTPLKPYMYDNKQYMESIILHPLVLG